MEHQHQVSHARQHGAFNQSLEFSNGGSLGRKFDVPRQPQSIRDRREFGGSSKRSFYPFPDPLSRPIKLRTGKSGRDRNLQNLMGSLSAFNSAGISVIDLEIRPMGLRVIERRQDARIHRITELNKGSDARKIKAVTSSPVRSGPVSKNICDPLGEPMQFLILQFFWQIAHITLPFGDCVAYDRRIAPRMTMCTYFTHPRILPRSQLIHSKSVIEHRRIDQIGRRNRVLLTQALKPRKATKILGRAVSNRVGPPP
jgi:hypothetical protein